jgi:hypothetical protein
LRGLIDEKADKEHTHTISDITDYEPYDDTELRGLIDEKADKEHTHTIEDIINLLAWFEEKKPELKGEKGDKGDKGEMGPQGERGPQGPSGLDGKDGEVTPYTTFTLLTEIDYNISVAISFDFNTTTYSGQFELSPVNSRMVVNFDINSLGESFIVTVSGKGVNEKINMVKQTVDGLKTPVNAVNSLLLTQPDLIDSYKIDGVFCAEISVRLIIENGSAYYYVGITDTKEKTIAFLLDGVSLETLAKREIF